jgi:hypothetical protein
MGPAEAQRGSSFSWVREGFLEEGASLSLKEEEELA